MISVKTKIKVTIKNKEENLINMYNAIYIEDKKIIKYQETDKTNVTLNIKDNILVRENNKIYMQYTFIKNKVTKNRLRLKEISQSIIMDLKTINIKKEKKNFEVKYKLLDSNDIFTYKVIVED